MLVALVATVLSILVAQVLPAVRWRQALLAWWPYWLKLVSGRSAWGWLLAWLPPVLLLAVLQWVLQHWLFGVVYAVFCVLVVVLCWGPRDLERDVETLIYAEDAASQEQARAQLHVDMNEPDRDTAPITQAVAVALLRRALGVMFWFIVLGPVGALGYRLLATAAAQAGPLSLAAHERLRGVLALLEWPVAQLAVFSFALMGNCSPVIRAWHAQGRWQAPSVESLVGVGMAAALPAEPAQADQGRADLPVWERQPSLRRAMRLSWRTVGLWCALMLYWQLAVWLG